MRILMTVAEQIVLAVLVQLALFSFFSSLRLTNLTFRVDLRAIGIGPCMQFPW